MLLLPAQSSPFGMLTRARKAHQTLSAEHARQRWIREEIARAGQQLDQALAAPPGMAAP